MKVLVTGAAGFVALNIIESLIEENHEVHALIRKTSKRDYLEPMIQNHGVKIHIGDITDVPSLDQAMVGMDAVIHTAALTSQFKKDKAAVFRTNVDGTGNVIESALKNKVRRMVYTSTNSTIGTNSNGKPADEEVKLNGFRARGQYNQSKVKSEEIVQAAVSRGLETIILNPTEVMGPYDYHFGWGSVILGLMKDEFPFIPTGGANFCHARDIADAHTAALTKGKVGERYILGGQNIKFAELFDEIIRVTGASLPSTNLNYWMIAPYFKILEWSVSLGLAKNMPPLDQLRLRSLYHDFFYTSEKAEKELGYTRRSLHEMVQDSYDWYKNNGFI